MKKVDTYLYCRTLSQKLSEFPQKQPNPSGLEYLSDFWARLLFTLADILYIASSAPAVTGSFFIRRFSFFSEWCIKTLYKGYFSVNLVAFFVTRCSTVYPPFPFFCENHIFPQQINRFTSFSLFGSLGGGGEGVM